LTVPFTTESVDDQPQNGHSENAEEADYTQLFDAPDYATFIKRPKTKQATAYEQKAASFLKLFMTGAINAGRWPDAAAIIDRGPAFAAAVGDFADSSERVRNYIDFIMSPDAPSAKFIMTAIPLVAQLFRNHEEEIHQVSETVKQTRAERRAARKQAKESGLPGPKPQVRVEKKILGRWTVKIPIRILKLRFNPGKLLIGFRTATEPPQRLAFKVFSDERVVKALRQQGIYLNSEGGNGGQEEAN
jgi:hypothetical protein